MQSNTDMSKSHYQIGGQTNSPRLNSFQGAFTRSIAESKAPRRVLFIAYQFPPSLEMGARTCAQIARHLPTYGWQPVVLTVDEKYIEKQNLGGGNTRTPAEGLDPVIRAGRLPHPFDFYRLGKSALSPSAKQESAQTAGRTTNTGNTGAEEKGRLRVWLLSVLGIPDIYTGWLIPAVLAGWRAIRRTKAEAIISSAPCWTNHLVGYCLMRLTGLPWVAHYRDPWVVGRLEGAIRSNVELRVATRIERMTLECSSAVVCVTEEHCQILRAAYPQVPAHKFHTVPNGFDSSEWVEFDQQVAAARSQDAARDKFVITYAGKLYIYRNPMPVFRALRKLIDRGEISPERVRVDLIGWCEVSEGRSIKDLIAETGLTGCVNLTGVLSHGETLRRVAQSDLLLLLAEGLTLQIPGKTFEYLKAGRPILALTSEGAVANLIRQTNAGWSIDPADDDGVTDAVREAYQQWESGQIRRIPDQSVVAGFERGLTTSKLGDLFDRLTQP